MASPLTTVAAALTKSGGGTLILTSTGNTYTGPTTVNFGALLIDSLNKLGNNGSGGLVLSGGTLRFGAVFDPSTIAITLGITATGDVTNTVGGTLDTNGLDIILNNAIGNGGNGGLIKAGTGTLTLNAAVNYTGTTTVSAGTLIFGVNQALALNSDLVLGRGHAQCRRLHRRAAQSHPERQQHHRRQCGAHLQRPALKTTAPPAP